jgi:hypothetical protein
MSQQGNGGAAAPATTFGGFFEELKAEAAAKLKALEDSGSALFHRIADAGAAMEQEVVKDFGEFRSLAVDTVMQLQEEAYEFLTGDEKNTRTVATILRDAEAKGIAMALADAQVIAQLAYRAVFGEKA